MNSLDILEKMVAISFVMALFATGCGHGERATLDELEHEAGAAMILPLALYEGSNPGKFPTNLSHLFSLTQLETSHRLHPYRLQERFRAFGKEAGFTNSIYEKYVFIPQRITNLTEGEPILMSAHPFIDRNGDEMRTIIWRAGKQDYRVGRLKERSVQIIFEQNKIEIPRPVAAQSPPVLAPLDPKPIDVRIKMYFRDIAGNLGIGRGSWWIVLLVYVGAAVAVFGVLFLWFSKSRGP